MTSYSPSDRASNSNIGQDTQRVIAPYPAGTLFEADFVSALHSLVPLKSSAAQHEPGPSASPFARGRQQPSSSSGAAEALHPQASRGPPGPRPPATTKRFKPTLNCFSCVQRKTRCDRARPSCYACVQRGKPCSYSALADVLHSSSPRRKRLRHGPKGSPAAVTVAPDAGPLNLHRAPSLESREDDNVVVARRSSPRPSTGADAVAHPELDNGSNVTFEHSRPSSWTQAQSVGDLASMAAPSKARTSPPGASRQSTMRHPFAGEWTSSRGLDEIVQVMPNRALARSLLATYMDRLDPISPICCVSDLYQEHDAYWETTEAERSSGDPTQLAFFLSVYACAAQLASSPSDRQLVELCLSASHRALALSLYFLMHSLRRCQAIFLLCQCLISDGRVREAWTFAGINQRQAESLGLGRIHEGVADIPVREQRQRARLWAALIHQDNVMSCLLKIPRSLYGSVSFEAIAQAHFTPPTSMDQGDDLDTHFVADCQYYTILCKIGQVGENDPFVRSVAGCSSHPSAENKARTLELLQSVLPTVQPPFANLDSVWIEEQGDPRLLRQGIELLCVYHYNLTRTMTLDGVTSPSSERDRQLVINSVHESMAAFFTLASSFPDVTSAWSACHALTFLQAVAVGTLLKNAAHSSPTAVTSRARDPLLLLARSNFDRYLEYLTRSTLDNNGAQEYSERVLQLKRLRKEMRVER